jgi:hypothetical protein
MPSLHGKFEQLALTSVRHKPKMKLRYVDMFTVWPQGPDELQKVLDHINNPRPSFQFTMDIACNNTLPFLVVLIIKTDSSQITTVYKKPTHIGHYLQFQSSHPLCVKQGIVQSLYNRVLTNCQEQKDIVKEVEKVNKIYG